MTHIGVSDLCDGDPQNVVVKTGPDATTRQVSVLIIIRGSYVCDTRIPR